MGWQALSTRFAIKPQKASESQPIWLHALSVGEVLSAVPLLKALRSQRPEQAIAVSVTTTTGFAIARQELAPYMVSLFYFPFDLSFAIHRTLQKVNPILIIIVETDLWPNFQFEMQRRRIPVFLVNARLSPRSFRNYRKLGWCLRPMLNSFEAVCVQSLTDARRFTALGLAPSRVVETGNLKFDQLVRADINQPLKKNRVPTWLQADQAVWVAGSTHQGEETILLSAFVRLRPKFPMLQLIIAPRDPSRSTQISQIASGLQLKVATFTKLRVEAMAAHKWDVLIIDTLGLLKQLYASATFAFVGGSLAPFGGHNPIEPAALACPILFGPDMTDFKEVSQMLLASGGALQVSDERTLYEAASKLLSDPGSSQKMGRNAYQTIQRNQGAVRRTLDVIKPYLL
jgi:3-deoxy-D-manno-octulosonic-acid transferase